MSDRRYTEDHEWVLLEGDTASIGISDYAQEQLGDVVYVELPEEGAQFEEGAQVATVESVKAASEIYAPVAGEVVEVNGALDDDPRALFDSPASRPSRGSDPAPRRRLLRPYRGARDDLSLNRRCRCPSAGASRHKASPVWAGPDARSWL